jgi:hypothetical protein
MVFMAKAKPREASLERATHFLGFPARAKVVLEWLAKARAAMASSAKE